MALQAAGNVPNPDCFVRSSQGNLCPVGRNRGANDALGMAERPLLGATVNVPGTYRFVGGSANDLLAIRRELNAGYRAFMAPNHQELRSACNIPHTDRLVCRPGYNPLAIWGKGHAFHRTLMAAKHAEILPGFGVPDP